MQVTGDQANLFAAFPVQVGHRIMPAGLVVGDHTAELQLLPPDQLSYSNTAGLDIFQKPSVSPGGRNDDPIDKAAAQAVQAFLLSLRIVVGRTDERAVAELSGLLLDPLQDLRENRHVKSWNDNPDGMAFSLAQCLRHYIRMVTEFFGGGIDSLFGIGMNIRSVVQSAGNRAHIYVGQLRYVFKSCHFVHLLVQTFVLIVV